MKTRPVCLACILCGGIGKGPRGGKSLIDLISILRVHEFPETTKFFVHSRLIDGKGAPTMRLEFVDPSGDVLAESTTVVEFDQPSESYFLDSEINATLSLQGIHMVRLWCDDDLLSEPRMKVDYVRGDPRAKW
jgi:hypothetical protein